MGLREQLEEDRKKLEELQGETPAEETKPVEEKPEVKVDEPAKEAVEVKAEEEKTEEKPVEEIAKSPVQVRLEKKKKEQILSEELASQRAELAAARARIAELETPPKSENINQEPNRADDPTAWLEWKDKQLEQKVAKIEAKTDAIERKEKTDTLRQSALGEIQGYEAQVRAKFPDYDAAKSHYATILATGVKLLNPNITNQQLTQFVEQKMIERAAQYQRDGYENPIEAMYEEAKTWGFKTPAKEAESKEIKPDLKKVAVNRAKNAGTASAQGSGGQGEITLTHLAREMTVGEIAKLPKGQVEKILRQSQMGE